MYFNTYNFINIVHTILVQISLKRIYPQIERNWLSVNTSTCFYATQKNNGQNNSVFFVMCEQPLKDESSTKTFQIMQRLHHWWLTLYESWSFE